MSDEKKDMISDENKEKDIVPDFSDFTSFLTAEDRFRMGMEKYIPEFMVRLKADTLMQDEYFVNWTIELQEIGKEAGIDMQQYILDYAAENGYN
ncbi:MAG: hypothetical protein K5979_12300 [Ruminococcus sp.]|nr:hypothetical protein [Ruminococcus sp.]